MPIQTVSQAFSNEGVGGFSFRNKIINGAMEIDQRNAGSAVTPTSLTYSLDRWAGAEQTDGSLTIQRSTTAPTGFNNSLLVTITSADTSIGSTQYSVIRQAIEGNNVEDLAWGTASARPITISFWVRSSLTGTFGGAIQNSAQDRSYAFSYTISSANTFEYKTITIPGDTSGTWLTNEGVGLFLWFSFASGSSYSGTGNTWTGSLLFAPTGATNVQGTNGATWFITGVQLEVGSIATPFERRPYGTELQLCLRYYTNNFFGTQVVFWNSSLVGGFPRFPVPMRANPTVNLSSGSNISLDIFGVGQSSYTITAADTVSQYGCRIYGTPASLQPTGITGHFSSTNVQASAEL